MIFPEYVGLTQQVACLIELHRVDLTETKNDILLRIIPRGHVQEAKPTQPQEIDFGQGIRLPVGEKLYLYLSKPNDSTQKPDGTAYTKADGLYVDDKKITPSRGSLIAPAMHLFQQRLGHFDSKGKPVSLSAYRQWHVVRNGSLVSLDELKDPKLARRRATKAGAVDVQALLAELGIG